MSEFTKLPLVMRLAAIVALLAVLVASLQAVLIIGFLWHSREALFITHGLGQTAYLDLAARVPFVLVGFASLFAILFRSLKQGARASLVLNGLLLIALAWSLLQLVGTWPEYLASLNSMGRVIYPISRLVALCWLVLGSRAIWGFAFPARPSVEQGT